MPATTSAAKASAKAKRSRIITLLLPPDVLAQFPHEKSSSSKTSSSAPPSEKNEATPSIQQPTPAPADGKTPESNATPVPGAQQEQEQEQDPNSLAPPKTKKKGGWPAGRKRAPPSIDPNAPPRERGRPGPKKKPRLPDGTIDRSHDPVVAKATGNPIPAHKLGPKANTGAINAGLRALDRSGRPCRKWERKGLQLKSFTGTMWNMSSWGAPQRNGSDRAETKSDSTGSSEVNGDKPRESSAVASEERSHADADANGDQSMTGVIKSSPAPPIAG